MRREIASLKIDLRARTIVCKDADDLAIPMSLSRSGGIVTKYVNASAGGLIIRALMRMLDNRDGRT